MLRGLLMPIRDGAWRRLSLGQRFCIGFAQELVERQERRPHRPGISVVKAIEIAEAALADSVFLGHGDRVGQNPSGRARFTQTDVAGLILYWTRSLPPDRPLHNSGLCYRSAIGTIRTCARWFRAVCNDFQQ